MTHLMQYNWPGNVRELEHTIERAVVLSKGDQLDIALPNRTDTPVIAEPSTETPMDLSLGLQATLHSVERQMVLAALHQGKGVQAEAARILGISRSNLNYRINKLGIKVAEVRFV